MHCLKEKNTDYNKGSNAIAIRQLMNQEFWLVDDSTPDLPTENDLIS